MNPARLPFAFAILLALAAPAVAADKLPAAAPAEDCKSLPAPAVLKSRIDAAEDQAAFLKIFNMKPESSASPAWACFLGKVERADPSLDPALTSLSTKPYWLASPDVDVALSRALAVRPTLVLKMIGSSRNPARSTDVICRVNAPYGTTGQQMDEAHRKVYKALGGVADEDLTGARQQCFQNLAAHLREWKDLRQLAGDAPVYR